MANEKPQKRIRQHKGEVFDTNRASDNPALERLRRRFEAFRREHRLRTPIPQALREQVLAQLSGGTPELMVRRACRISPEQLFWWRKAQSSGAQRSDHEQREVRVFPVVDEVAESTVERDGGSEAQELQLCVGGWAICVRRVQQ